MPVLATLSAFATGTTDGAGSDSTSRQVQVETAALANGIDYLVLFEGGAAPDGGTGTVVECDLQIGSTEYALSRGTFPPFNPPDGGVRAARLAGACLVTGNGSATASIGTRRVNGSAGDETLWSGGGVKCIPLDSLTENTHFWQHQGANDTTADTTPTGGGGWTQVGSAVTFTAPTTGTYLVIMSVESQHQSDATTTDAVRIRFRQTTDPSGTPTTITLGGGDNSGALSPAIQLFAPSSSPETVIGHTRYEQVVSLTQGEEYSFFIEVESPSGGGNTEYRRERIFVFDGDAWAGGFATADETVGQQLASPGPATFGPLNIADPSPDTHEYTFLAGTTFQNNNTWHRSRFDLNGTDFPSVGGWGAGGFVNGTGSTVDFHWLTGLAEADVSGAYAVNFEVTHDTSDCPVGFAINHAGSGDPTEPSIRSHLIAWRMETTTAPPDEEGDGTSAGAATVDGVAAVTIDGEGDAVGDAVGDGTGALEVEGSGTAAGVASVDGASASEGEGEGTSAGSAAGDGTATLEVEGDGTALGAAVLDATATVAVEGFGTAIGTATVVGVAPLGFSDEFDDVALDAKWLIEDVNGAIGAYSESGGAFTLPVTAGGPGNAFWYDANEAPLVYQEIDGDFDVVADVECQNAAGTSTPPLTDFRITGIAAHDPNRALLNYVHIGVGSTNTADLRVEYKNTIDSVTGPDGDTYPGFGSVSNPSGRAEVRLRRVGQQFTCMYRATPGSGTWITILDIDRTPDPMPSTLRVGMMTYASVADHDIQGVFRYIREYVELEGASVSDGTATGDGVAQVSIEGDGIAAGVASAVGVGETQVLVEGDGIAAGTASTSGEALELRQGDGASAGTTTVAAIAAYEVGGVGQAQGVATITGEGAVGFDADGLAQGTATCVGVGVANALTVPSPVRVTVTVRQPTLAVTVRERAPLVIRLT